VGDGKGGGRESPKVKVSRIKTTVWYVDSWETSPRKHVQARARIPRINSYQPTVVSWPFHNIVASVHRLEYRQLQNSIKTRVFAAQLGHAAH